MWHVLNGRAVSLDITVHVQLPHGLAILPEGQSGRVTLAGDEEGLRPISVWLKLTSSSSAE